MTSIAGTPVSPSGSNSSVAPQPAPAMQSMMGTDPSTQQAIMLGVTNATRAVLMGRGVNARESFVITLADYVYLRFVKGYLQPLLQSWSGESQYSSGVAEALGISIVLMATKRLGITSTSEVPQGAIDVPRIGSGVVGDIIDSMLQAGELVLERGVLTWTLAKTGAL